ncbi:MAG TPA: DUF3052 family protein [Thermoanaerobaculia bacterium]|nr:DUF3052 family protein [Thermoanaerobaculia bacterium]
MTYDGQTAEAKALLETEELIVRGAIRVKVPFRDVKEAVADGNALVLRWSGHELRAEIGKDAAKWAEKIRNPKSVLDKLGVKAQQKVSIVGKLDGTFVADLENRTSDVSARLRKASDVIFYACDRREDLAKLATLRESLVANGAIWVIRPKGAATISESDVMAAGKRAGLVDTKVVKFSETHTAEKLVIPVTER